MKKVKVIREKDGKEYNKKINSYLTGDAGDAVSYIQVTYPETTKMFQDMQFEQWELFCKKQKDYGPKNISVGTNLETEEDVKLALTGLWFRMNDKMQRFQQIVMNNQEPENESLMDTFMDLANYAIIAQLVKEKAWGR
jgi:hypothetical protein